MALNNSGFADRNREPGQSYDLETPFVNNLQEQLADEQPSGESSEEEFRLPTSSDFESEITAESESGSAALADFQIAHDRTMRFEGGYANVKGDRGGETYKGVARNFQPQWAGWSIVDAAKSRPNFPRALDQDSRLQALVAEFYRAEFWNKVQAGHISSQVVANELFDCSVNMGTAAACRILQRALNLLSAPGSPQLTEDGSAGNRTTQAVVSWLRQPNLAEPVAATALLSLMLMLRGMRYIQIIERNSTQRQFAYNWFRRLFKEPQINRRDFQSETPA